MNRTSRDKKMLPKWLVLSLLLIVPALAFGQHKTSSAPAPKASAPAQHASAPKSAPSHSSAPQHSAAPNRQAAGGSRPGASAGRPNTAAGRPNNAAAGRSNTTAGRPNTAGARGNTAAGRPNTAGANRGNTAAGRTNAPAGRNNAAAGNAGRGAANTRASASHTPPGKQVSLKGGGSAHIRPNGQIRSVNRNGMHIEHGMHGGRHVESTRNGARVVSYGGRRGGFVQRAYVTRGGHSYYSRTYYRGGVAYAGVYRGYYWGGHPYYGYYPAYYYGPAYYGWAYNPWPAPVAYGWGWGGAPWYGYYGAYFTPYPVYPSAAFWLADYLVASSLQAAYATQAEGAAEGWLLRPYQDQDLLVASLLAPPAPADTAKLSPEIKKVLADEVKGALAEEQADAAKGKSSSAAPPASKDEAPPALNANFKTFMVTTDLSLVVDGEECALSNGDVVERTSDSPDADQNINVKVLASTKTDCAVGKEGPIAMDDLQEMYNSFRESLKDGMGELAKKQGTGGLPKAPDTTTTAGDVPAPEPDKSAEKALQDQQQQADQTEAQVKQEAGSGGGGTN